MGFGTQFAFANHHRTYWWRRNFAKHYWNKSVVSTIYHSTFGPYSKLCRQYCNCQFVYGRLYLICILPWWTLHRCWCWPDYTFERQKEYQTKLAYFAWTFPYWLSSWPYIQFVFTIFNCNLIKNKKSRQFYLPTSALHFGAFFYAISRMSAIFPRSVA